MNPVHLGIKESNLTDQFSIFFAQSRAHPKDGTPHLRRKKNQIQKKIEEMRRKKDFVQLAKSVTNCRSVQN